jgi:outer membrane protein assembly factor BamB
MVSTGDMLLVPGGHGTLFIVELKTGRMTREVVLGAESLLEPLAIGESIVVGDVRGRVHIIDAESFDVQATIVIGGTVEHASVAGDLAIFASVEGMVVAIDPVTASEAWQAVVTGTPVQVQVVGNGIAIGMDTGDLVMLNAADGTIRWCQALVASPFTDIAFTGTEVLGITEAGDLLMVDMVTGAPAWRAVLPSGGWFARDQCDPGCPAVTDDGSIFLFAPASREHPIPVTAIQEVAAPPIATGEVLVVVTEQGDVHGWVLDPA